MSKRRKKQPYQPKNKNTVSRSIKKRLDIGKEQRLDSFGNSATGWGMGGVSDSIGNTDFYRPNELHQRQLNALYNFNWLAKRAVDAPVDDMFSNWFSFLQTNEDDQEETEEATEGEEEEDKSGERINNIVADIEEMEMQAKLTYAFQQKRLHRGSIIWFDYGDDPELPLSFDPKPGDIERIEIVSSWYAYPTTDYTIGLHGDNGKIGEPEHYTLTIFHDLGSETLDVHESRVIRLKGLPPAGREESANRLGWGFSILEAFNEALKQFGVGMAASADILQKFHYITLKLDDLAELIRNSEDDLIIKSAQYAVNALNSQNVGIFGQEGELKRESATVSGIQDITDRLSNQVCAAAHPGIPHSILFSAEGGALGGNSAEQDIRTYHKRINSLQEAEGRPAVNQFLYFMGYDFKDYPYEWNAIADQTETEKLENFKLWMEGIGLAIDKQVLLPEEATQGTFGQDKIKYLQISIDEDLRERVEEEREKEMENEGAMHDATIDQMNNDSNQGKENENE